MLPAYKLEQALKTEKVIASENVTQVINDLQRLIDTAKPTALACSNQFFNVQEGFSWYIMQHLDNNNKINLEVLTAIQDFVNEQAPEFGLQNIFTACIDALNDRHQARQRVKNTSM